MARAKTVTKLSLDSWAEILGINPLHFNGLYSEVTRQTCGHPYFQFAYQDAHKLAREDLARAIALAEQRIESYIGYNLLPGWSQELKRVTPPVSPELYGSAITPRYARKSISATKGYVISGGQKATALIEAGAGVVRTDEDGDSYEETMTVLVTTAIADCEIRAFYPGKSGASEWEIRPIEISSSAGVATITFKSWQLVDPDLQGQLSPDVAGIDGDAAGSYLTTIDVYRVYNDPQQQVLFMWENLPDTCDCGSSTCTTCAWGTQYGCLQVRDNRLGLVTFAPGTWNTDDEVFNTAEFSVAREPEKTRLWYYSGWEDLSLDCPRTEMDFYWAQAVAYYAAGLLDRAVCDCTAVSNFIDYWREDLARQGTDRSFQISASQADNLFGSTRGALFARAACMQDGKRVAK